MNKSLSGRGVIAAMSLLCVSGVVVAQEDAYEFCVKSFTDSSYGSEPFRASCAAELARRQADLAAWGINTAGMSGIEAWDRHDRESVVRQEARREQERRDRLESERLAAEKAAADADRQKTLAEQQKRTQEYGAAQMLAGQQMLQEQNEMLKGLGVNMGSASVQHEDCVDEDIMADELNLYQTMVDNGAAPGCNGLTCGELVDCVDTALDAEED